MYYWNTNGDLLDGATLEDPVEGIPAPGGPVADEESSEPKKMSASQKIRLQVEEDKRREREVVVVVVPLAATTVRKRHR